MAMNPNVAFERKELKRVKKLYRVISDCIGGETVVKAASTRYLPIPNDGSDAKANSARYGAYLLRAVFYNVTKRTIDGLCGQIFSRDPLIEVPDAMDFVKTDADGAGVSLTQVANRACRLDLAYGRAGLLVDYPTTDGALTAAQLASGDIRPVLTLYEPEKIINWRTISRGARQVLSLVVLEECYESADDGFEAIERKQWRVLKLVNNVYTVEIHKDTGNGGAKSITSTIPTGKDGQPFNEIPFTFIGAEDNDSTVDEPPMYDIAALNISHYRNSADYEESVFMVGQPTPVFTGLTEDWSKNVMKGEVFLGSRGAILLPVGGDAKLLQAAPNSMPMEAMQHKEKQMVALGAKVVEKRAVVRTASEANIDYSTESSVLSSIAKNVSAAFTIGLKWMTQFTGEDATNIKFELNTDFDIAKMSAEDRRQLIEDWQSGAITWAELRAAYRKAGYATEDDETAKATIEEEQAKAADAMISEAKKMSAATKPAQPNQPATPPKKTA